MDVIIPAHNIKTLSSSISTLSKIGKILYIEFDPLDGLTLRSLNDAKSSFLHFHFEVGFFERCTTSSSSTSASGTGIGGVGVLAEGRLRNRRQRKSKKQGSTSSTKRMSGFSRKRNRQSSRSSRGNNNDSDDGEDNENDNDQDNVDDDEKYLCKVPIKTIGSILRPRKGVTSLRIRSHNSVKNKQLRGRRSSMNDDQDYDDNECNEEEEFGSHMQLSFEYQIQSDGIMRVVHKVGVSSADGIIAIAPKQNCSEIITQPKVLLTMLDQVKSTTEVALTVNDSTKKVIASSFHYGDAIHDGSNLILNTTNAAILKTETSIDCHEFEDFHFMDDGAVQSVIQEEEAATENATVSCPPPPEGVTEQVILVFSIKEAKAMLQFCALSQSSYVDEEDASVILSFYWGGKPLIIETEGGSFHGELILATVDHSLLSGMSTASDKGNSNVNESGDRTRNRLS